MSVFSFVDNVSEAEIGQSITAFFTLTGGEEFLLDHFKGFPVMPGVLLLESLKQTACVLLKKEGAGSYRLDGVQQVKFGQFVKPGTQMQLNVRLTGREAARVHFEGRVHLVENLPAACLPARQGQAGGTTGPRAIQAIFSLVPEGATGRSS